MTPGEFRVRLESRTSDHDRQSCFRVNRRDIRYITGWRCTMLTNCDFQRVDESRGFDGSLGIAARQHHPNFFVGAGARTRNSWRILGSPSALWA